MGLLGVYNDAILSERAGQEAVQQWALALAALEQVRAAWGGDCTTQSQGRVCRLLCAAWNEPLAVRAASLPLSTCRNPTQPGPPRTQVQTLIELRAIHLEQRGKMSRYGPLIFLELLK